MYTKSPNLNYYVSFACISLSHVLAILTIQDFAVFKSLQGKKELHFGLVKVSGLMYMDVSACCW